MPALAPKLLTLSAAMLLAMSLVGCARHPDRQAHLAPGSRTCQAERVQLPPLSRPDCEFRASALKTVDPAGFARLKAAYERQCYRRAERAARERARRLRASNAC
jgi:hypothetical protein